jgi:hypothetical protein
MLLDTQAQEKTPDLLVEIINDWNLNYYYENKEKINAICKVKPVIKNGRMEL